MITKNTKYQINKLLKYMFLSILVFTNILFAKSINYTQQEIDYIKQNKTIKIAMLDNFKPFSFFENNKHQGLSVDILEKISILSGLKFNIQTSSWSTALNNFKEKKVDMISGISQTKKREKFALFSEPFYEIPTYVFGLKSDKIYKNNNNLKGKRVGVNKDMFYIDSLKELGIKVVEYPNNNQKAKALAFGKIDYYLSNYTTGLKAISSQSLTNIKPLDEFKSIKKEDIRYAINKYNKILHSIIEKSLNNIKENNINSLIYKWILEIKEIEVVNYINLTTPEEEYLKQKKKITMCIDPDWMPFEKFENGKHIGMSAEYFKIFQKNIPTSIEVIYTNTWSQSLEYAKSRKCDILSLAMETPERKEYLNFTKPYLSVPVVLATKLNITFIDKIKYLKNKKIGVVKNGAFSQLLKNEYKNLEIIEIDTVNQGLQKVENGELYGFVDTIISIGNQLQNNFTGMLKISARFDEKMNLSIGVRNDDPVLVGIFEKIIQTLSEESKYKILNKYISVKYEKGIDYIYLWYIIGVLLIIFLAFAYKQYILRKLNHTLEEKVEDRTKELIKKTEELEHSLREVSDSKKLIENIINNAPVRIFWKDKNSIYLGANKLFLNDADLEDKSQIIGKSDWDLKWKIEAQSYIDDDKYVMDTRESKIQFEETQTYEDGSKIYLVTSKIPLIDEHNNVIGVLGIYDDVTKQKLLQAELFKKDLQLFEQSKLASMGEMIGNIAHQWRQPLATINSSIIGIKTKIAMEKYDLSKEEERGSFLILLNTKFNSIENNVEHLSTTINTFQDFIKEKKEIKKVILQDRIDLTLNILEVSLSNNFIELKNNVDYKKPIEITMVIGELSQVLTNIINNAKDVLKQNKVDKPWIAISLVKKENIAIITIEDNGGGIPDDIMPRIFDPYFTTKHESQGTGLGLHMSYKIIVESLKGRLWAENTNNGAKFFIELSLS